MTGIGVIGCGAAAADLCRAIDRTGSVRLAATHDHQRDRASALAAPREAVVHDSVEELLTDPGVDAVYVGLPHHLLAPVTARALAAGRHVLVEKPAALSLAELCALDEDAGRRGLTLGVCYVLREAGAVREAARLLGQGAIGAVTAVRLRAVIDKPAAYWDARWRARRAEAGGGVVLMNGIHQIDLVAHLTGQRFVTAMAQVATLSAHAEVEDTAAAVLRLDGGGLASLVAHAHSPGARGEELMEFDATEGRLDLDPYGGGRLRVFLRRPWGGLPAGEWHEIAAPRRDPYAATLRGFLAAIGSGSPAPVGARDALAALATVLAVYTSATTGRAAEVAGPA